MTTPSRFRLWQPPGRFEDRPTERRISFLELFFDLVFVVVVAQLSHRLAEHPTWEGVGWFVFLFFAVWSSWTNGTLYYDLHGTNDVSVRVFTFAQMLAVAMMGVYIGSVPGRRRGGLCPGLCGERAGPRLHLVSDRGLRPHTSGRLHSLLRLLSLVGAHVRREHLGIASGALLALGSGSGAPGHRPDRRVPSLDPAREPGRRGGHCSHRIAGGASRPVRDHRPRRGDRRLCDRDGRSRSARPGRCCGRNAGGAGRHRVVVDLFRSCLTARADLPVQPALAEPPFPPRRRHNRRRGRRAQYRGTTVRGSAR